MVRKSHFSFLLFLILLHASLLAFDLTADPPIDIDQSLGIYTDEGWKTYAARNKALFDDWQPRAGLSRGWIDGSPLPTWFWYNSFELFGVSRAAARLPNLVFSMGSLLLLFSLARRAWGEKAALWTVALWVLDWNVLMFARLALQETQVAFWLLAALWTWCHAEKNAVWGAVTGLFLSAAFLSKASAAGPLTGFALGVLLEARRAEKWKASLAAMGALAVGLAPFLALSVRTPWAASGVHMAGRLIATDEPASAFLSAAIILENGYMTKILPTFAAALLGALLAWARWPWATIPERLSTLWLVGGLAGFAAIDYRPARYFPILAPAAVLLAASFAHQGLGALRAAYAVRSRNFRLPFHAGVLVSGFLFAYAALKLAPPPRGFLALAATLGAGLGLALLRLLARGASPALHGRPRGLILAAAMAFFAASWIPWAASREHRLVICGRILDACVPRDATLGGYQAVMLALETRVYVGDVDNPPGTAPSLSEKLARVRPTHVATTLEEFLALDPAIRQGAEKLANLPLMAPFANAAVWRLPQERQ